MANQNLNYTLGELNQMLTTGGINLVPVGVGIGRGPEQEGSWVKSVSAAEKIYPGQGLPSTTPVTIPNTTSKDIIKTGGDNGGGGNGGGGNDGGGGGKSEEDAARIRYEARRREIESRLNAAKQYVQELVGHYGKTRDETKGNIKTTYDKLKDFIAEKLQQSIGQLDQSDVDVQNTYGRLGGNARRAMENVLTKNNLLAKAMGNAGSSWYQNLQTKSRNEGTTNIFDNEAEQASKRSAIGLQKGATTTEFGQDAVAADSEKTKLLADADAKYNEDVAKAKLLEQNYGIDSEAAIDEAQANLDDAYRKVEAYNQNRVGAATTGQTYGDTNSKLQDYSALNKISNTLNNNTSANKVNQYLANTSNYSPISGGAPMSYPANSFENIIRNKNQKKYEEDPTQYYIR